jgi:hypothetical protein
LNEFLEFQAISKRFGTIQAVDNVSLEIRKEYIEPLSHHFPEMQFIPYVIPGRTGTQLLPQDLAIMHQQYPNVSAVKEATGDLENMRLTRKLCGANFNILSGDDDKTYAMMTAPDIAAPMGTPIVVKGTVTDIAAARNKTQSLDGSPAESLQYLTRAWAHGWNTYTCRNPSQRMLLAFQCPLM